MMCVGGAGMWAFGVDKLEAEVCGLPWCCGVSHQLLHVVPGAAQTSREACQKGGPAGGPEECCSQSCLSCITRQPGLHWAGDCFI